MSATRLASVIINNHNYGGFLKDAIESALVQTHHATEVIVVDDGSTDESRDVIAGYGERSVPVFKSNGGQASAFNAGIARSRGGLAVVEVRDRLCLGCRVKVRLQIYEEIRTGQGVRSCDSCGRFLVHADQLAGAAAMPVPVENLPTPEAPAKSPGPNEPQVVIKC